MNKLNPLKTKHDLIVSIDDVDYSFTYKSVNKQVQAELEEFKNKSSVEYEAIDEKRAEVKGLLELKALNEQILKDGSLTDKAKVWFEQKTIVVDISKLEKEIRNLESSVSKINDKVEEYYKKQFDLCVIGEGKAAFKKGIEDKGIAYSVINLYIAEALRELQEKK